MAKKEKIPIDIAQIEEEQQADHWLAPHERFFGKHEKQRQKSRDEWLAKQPWAKDRATAKRKRWMRARAAAHAALKR
ncbi:MAG TPA: hypothetical protein VKE42_10135 [Candidatus Cybelea sp.]|nr:hypothetical protein [Candidatus Cybelea sp.]